MKAKLQRTSLRPLRIFSLEVKKQIVQDIEEGKCTKLITIGKLILFVKRTMDEFTGNRFQIVCINLKAVS